MSKNLDNKLDMIHSLAIKDRKIMLYDEVDNNSVFMCIFYLNKLRTMDALYKTKKPIWIYINTNGGTVYDGFALISLIEEMKNDGYEINTVNMGYAFSMGFTISVVGTNRYSYRYGTYMFHDVAFETGGPLQSVLQSAKEAERIRDITRNIVLKYTNLKDADIDSIFNTKTNKFYSAEEALDLKICDKIL